jgi:hypothetical protein
MLRMRTGSGRRAETERPIMNALAAYYVARHLQELADEAAARRRFDLDRPSLRARLATATRDARRRLGTPLDDRRSVRTTFDESPHRS